MKKTPIVTIVGIVAFIVFGGLALIDLLPKERHLRGRPIDDWFKVMSPLGQVWVVFMGICFVVVFTTPLHGWIAEKFTKKKQP